MRLNNNYIGTGLYSIPQAARLVGTSTSKIRRWTRQGEALLKRKFSPSDDLLSFVELMELQFIKLFRDEGVSLSTIRKAAKAAARKFHTDYPFAVKRFDTDGQRIFATLKSQAKPRNKILIDELDRGQLVFEQLARPFFKKLEYPSRVDDFPSRYWPLGRSGRVVLDPTRGFGQPIDSTTGISTKTLSDAVRAGGGQDSAVVADWFGVPVDAVTAAVRFEATLAS